MVVGWGVGGGGGGQGGRWEVGRELILRWNFIGQTASLHFNWSEGGGFCLRMGPLGGRPAASCR